MLITRPTNAGRAALFAIFATQSNDFAIGYPMIDALYSSTHPEYASYLYLMAPISLAILNPIGFVLLEIGKRRIGEPKSGWSLVASVVKGIASNPILFMTVLGIIGNIIFSHHVPIVLSEILDVFGKAFSGSALFLLGLMMVGKVHTLKGAALVTPGILILIKLLVLPLVIRESVILLAPGVNETDTKDLSTYGFLYGTIPTAPALFIFTLRYNLEIDLIASAMVACTFLSAPLMFVSAKLINAINDGANYSKQLNSFIMDISIASLTACVWLIICFFISEEKKWKRPTHRCTACIIIAQFAVCIGLIIWTQLDINDHSSALWYIQFILISTGVYVSRLLTAVMALTILFLSSRSLSFVNTLQKSILPAALAIPIVVVGLMCLMITPSSNGNDDDNLRNPNFQLGRVQAAMSIFILLFSFIVTLGCLVLQQRYQRRHHADSYASLIGNQENAESTVVESRTVVDVEDLVLPNGNCGLDGGCGLQRNLCAATSGVLDECEPESEYLNDNLRRDNDDPQILRHLVLLIILLCSMLFALALSFGTMIMEEMIGIYAELAFLDVAFNFGQALIVFGIFGLDPSLGKLGPWLMKIAQDWRARQKLQLPDEESLSPEVKSIREQFRQCHLRACRDRISMCRRRLLKVYEGAFSGCDLVDWLLEEGIAQTRDEAVRYGRCLLESRVLHHVDDTHHFQDKNILYTFRG
ncbi:integral membrane protein GPR155 isoform X2 [Aphidius gifuensis]|nr:integral membrane protein GPR155 isoform X2 [Aphidius gifuensis]